MADWFDSEIWKLAGHHEYHEPVEAEALLSPAPESIWPGLMNPNLIPIVSNGIGDWLCASVGADSQIVAIVQWYHGGGDWIIWGKDIAEAIVFDAVQSRLPGPRRRHAEPAQGAPSSPVAPDNDPLLKWAVSHLHSSIGEAIALQVDSHRIAEILLQTGVAEVAVRCELVQDVLHLSAFSAIDSQALQSIGVDADEVSRWSLDHERIPPNLIERLPQPLPTQDWSEAENHAVAVSAIAPDTSWGWDIAGYAAGKRGDSDAARMRYTKGSQCPIFSDQSIRLQTHWAVAESGKFSVAMLVSDFSDSVAESDYLRAITHPNPIRRSDNVSAYWLDRGEGAVADGRFADAYQYFVAAGWDIGMRPITAYGRLLEKIASAAEMSGQVGRGRIARIHRKCLRDRYGS